MNCELKVSNLCLPAHTPACSKQVLRKSIQVPKDENSFTRFFALFFVACLGVFWCASLLLFSPQKWTVDPSSPLQNCYKPHCTHEFLQYFYRPGCYCFTQTLAPYPGSAQACGAIPYHPDECGARPPGLLCRSLDASWGVCLVSELCENSFGTSTEMDISSLIAMFAQENRTLHRGSALVFLSCLFIKMFIFCLP